MDFYESMEVFEPKNLVGIFLSVNWKTRVGNDYYIKGHLNGVGNGVTGSVIQFFVTNLTALLSTLMCFNVVYTTLKIKDILYLSTSRFSESDVYHSQFIHHIFVFV